MLLGLGQCADSLHETLGLAPKLFFKPVVELAVASLFFTCSPGLREQFAQLQRRAIVVGVVAARDGVRQALPAAEDPRHPGRPESMAGYRVLFVESTRDFDDEKGYRG